MTFLDSLRNYLSPQILVILCLGFISGVPYGVLMDPLNYWLSEEGIEKSTIGLLSLVFFNLFLKSIFGSFSRSFKNTKTS